MKINIEDESKHKRCNLDKKLVEEGMQKVKEALLKDLEDDKRKGSGLPKDWRDKIFDANIR